jgi:hypothetical protein
VLVDEMLKLLLSIVLIVSSCFIPAVTRSCFALDEGGCLTCHQYPGLVRHEKTDGFRVLHIDEEKFFNSAHGKFSCRKCHVTIWKVPHTGETKVDCTTECHQNDAEKISTYPLNTLHQKEQSYILSLEDKSSCRVCHPLYPHSDNKLVRGFLNMHAGFMYCEVCHIKRSKFRGLTYEWKDTENAEFSGEPFGTYYNPQTGKADKHDEHFISRIAAFAAEKGEKRSLMNTRDIGKANEFVLKEKSLKPEEKKEKLAYFHQDIERKEISVACDECHSANSILSFSNLGFNEKKTKDLIYLNIKGLVTKYKTFYFPKLFSD